MKKTASIIKTEAVFLYNYIVLIINLYITKNRTERTEMKIKKVAILATFLVRMKGLEPTQYCYH